MKWTKQILLSVILGLLVVAAKAQSWHADDVVGTWLTADKSGQITIYKSGDKYYGKIKGGNKKEQFDVNNPDKAHRKDPLIGLVILKNFTFGGNEWKDGTIYDPNNGKTYSCMMSLTNKSTLKIRGYIGFSWIGRTEVWGRVD